MSQHTAADSALFPNEISRGNPHSKRIALTFDGGSGKSYTRDIVSVVKRAKIPMTAFLTGSFITAHPDDTLFLVEHGFEIGNHSMTHPWLAIKDTWQTNPQIDRAGFNAEIDRAAETFTNLTGKRLSNLWRAPYGARSREVLQWGRERGLQHVYWSHDTADWRTDLSDPLSKSGTEIVDRLLEYNEHAPHGLSGAIILCHLGANRAVDPLYPHFGRLISSLQDQGYSFVTAGEMLRDGQEMRMSGDIPLAENILLPLSETLSQASWVEGYWNDSWVSQRFSVRLHSTRGHESIRIGLHLPEIFETQAVSVYIDQHRVTEACLARGETKELVCRTPARDFALDLHFAKAYCPFLLGQGADRRVLSAVLSMISAV